MDVNTCGRQYDQVWVGAVSVRDTHIRVLGSLCDSEHWKWPVCRGSCNINLSHLCGVALIIFHPPASSDPKGKLGDWTYLFHFCFSYWVVVKASFISFYLKCLNCSGWCYSLIYQWGKDLLSPFSRTCVCLQMLFFLLRIGVSLHHSSVDWILK